VSKRKIHNACGNKQPIIDGIMLKGGTSINDLSFFSQLSGVNFKSEDFFVCFDTAWVVTGNSITCH
jgi:hypothetical protein